MPIARVAINVPVDTLFDYSAEYISSSDIGLRVSVPFGKKRVAGIIIDVASDTSIDSKIKSIEQIFNETPRLPKELLDLFTFCSQYYHHSIGMVIMNALPATLRTSKPIKLPKDKISWNTMQLTLTETGKQTDLTSIPVRQRVARNLLNRFQQSGTISGRELKDSSPKIKQLIQQWLMCGWITKSSDQLQPIYPIILLRL